MSVKIPHGYRHPKRSLGLAFADMKSREQSVGTAMLRMLARVWASEAASRIDDAWSAGKSIPDHPLRGIGTEIRRRQREIKASGYRDPEVDMEAILHIVPHRGRVLILAQTEHEEIREAMTAGLEDYPYWDNTDRPEGITEREWRRRGAIWEAALEGGTTTAGLTMEYRLGSVYVDLSLILEELPDPKRRARRIAGPIAFREFIGPEEKPEMHEFSRIFHSPEYMGRVAEISEKLVSHLPDLRRILRGEAGYDVPGFPSEYQASIESVKAP